MCTRSSPEGDRKLRLFSCPLVASADAKSPCVAAQMMQKSHIIKEKGDCPKQSPRKNPQLHRFLEFRNALFDLLRLLLIQRQLALLLLHQRGGRLAHKARIVQLALGAGDFLV